MTPSKPAVQHEKILLRYVLNKKTDLVEELLKQTTEWDPTKLGRILWHALNGNCCLEITTMLVKAGADLSVPNPLGKPLLSLLHTVVDKIQSDFRYERLAILMMEHGADIDFRPTNPDGLPGDSILQYAIENNWELDLIKKIIKYGARLEELPHTVLKRSDPNTIISLFVDTDSLNNQTKIVRAASSLACCCSCIEVYDQSVPCAKAILEMGFPIKDLQEYHGSILCKIIDEAWPFDGIYSISETRIQMVQLLIGYGFEVNGTGDYYGLPLSMASKLIDSTFTEILIGAGAKVNQRDRHNKFPIHEACKNDSVENIQLLLRHGANVNVTDGQGLTPLSLMENPDMPPGLKFGYEMIIKHLAISVSKGKEINKRDSVLIERDTDVNNFYKRCLDELQAMKTRMIIGNVAFFSSFEKSIIEMAFLMRRTDFMKNYCAAQDEEVFPIFREEMEFAINSAKEHKKSLDDKEKAIEESLSKILDDVPLEFIIYYFYLNSMG